MMKKWSSYLPAPNRPDPKTDVRPWLRNKQLVTARTSTVLFSELNSFFVSVHARCEHKIENKDLAVKLSEVLVGVSVIAAVEERAGTFPLGDTACSVLVEIELATTSSENGDGAGTARGVVLKALMPVILMTSGKPDVPSR